MLQIPSSVYVYARLTYIQSFISLIKGGAIGCQQRIDHCWVFKLDLGPIIWPDWFIYILANNSNISHRYVHVKSKSRDLIISNANSLFETSSQVIYQDGLALLVSLCSCLSSFQLSIFWRLPRYFSLDLP